MPDSLTLLAAGSLKGAFLPLLARFQQLSGIPVAAQFGPAGLLRERIEGGERCSLFASANTEHPQALLQAGVAKRCCSFAANQLMLTVRRSSASDRADWLTLLRDPQQRLATSTPGCDPSGDYTWQLFSRLEARYPGVGRALMARAQPLVGGRGSPSVPAGTTAGEWLIGEDVADLFIGYAHYAVQMAASVRLRTILIPAPWNIRCEYQLAQIEESAAARQLRDFITGEEGQTFLRAAGFLAISDGS